MSRFFSQKYASLVPYVPGEQPQGRKVVKLNTNESPFPPSEKAQAAAAVAARTLNLYPDPECRLLTEKLANLYGVARENVILTNGSDEILNFAIMAFCDAKTPAVFPDISYGFYKVFAELNGVKYIEKPLRDDYTIAPEDYFDARGTILIANPNAPTGLTLSTEEIESILKHNPDNVVVIDEAYVDFGGRSCVPLIEKYENLLVTQTFSKSRSMAAARLGFGIASRSLMQDLNTIKYSTNPYNINAMTMAAGLGALEDEEYTRKNCRTIIENREFLTKALADIGFTTLRSNTNFIFTKKAGFEGKALYLALREKGIIVRHFDAPRTRDFLRITIGTRAECEALLRALAEITGVAK